MLSCVGKQAIVRSQFQLPSAGAGIGSIFGGSLGGNLHAVLCASSKAISLAFLV